MFCVLLKWHPMVGVDLHDEITATVPPVPAPLVPHVVGHVLNGWGLATLSPATVKADGMQMVMRGSDIANGIVHVPIPPYPPCALLPLIIPFSGSKSHFGPSSVKAGGSPIGAAVCGVVNVNLNCNSVVPLPSGFVVAPSTVVCGMTVGDVLGGVFAMASDAAFAFVLGQITGGIGKAVAGDALGKVAASVLGDTVSAVLQTLFGSPLGWAPPGAPVGKLGNALSDWARGIGEGIGDYFAPPVPPPGAPAPAPAAPPSPTAMQQLGAPAQPPPLPAGHPAQGIVEDPSVEELA